MARFSPSWMMLGLWIVGAACATTIWADEPDALTPAVESAYDLSDLADGIDAQPSQADGTREVEIIRERYPSRTVKVEREVAQDAEGNYVNHGSWTQWDPQGNLVAKGRYVDGQRDGMWMRWFRRGESKLFSEAPFDTFEEPFLSQATFDHGTMNGTWTIVDAKQRKVSELNLVSGRRQGPATLYYPSGKKMRETTFRDGIIDGRYSQWNQRGDLTSGETYQNGRKVETKISYHQPGQKASEGSYLLAALVLDQPDDWETARFASFRTTGKDEKHGTWTTWYPNGQTQSEGEYRNDLPVGKFTWWHSNGQKASEGAYENGVQHGRWVWWHANGQKKAEGAYNRGEQTGRWMLWKTDGHVAETSVHEPSTRASIARAQQQNGTPKHGPELDKPQPEMKK